jgi:hypothetical protein
MNPEESRQRKFVHLKSNWQSVNVLELRRWLLGVMINSRMTSFDLLPGLLKPAIVNNRSAMRGRCKEMFHFSETARSAVTPTQLPNKWVLRYLPMWIQPTVLEANLSMYWRGYWMSGPVLSFPLYTRIKSRSSAAHAVSQLECILYGGLFCCVSYYWAL